MSATSVDAGAGKFARSSWYRRPLSRRFPLGAQVALGAVLLLVALAVFGTRLVPQSPFAQDLFHRYASPTGQHWLGTDAFGRDTLSRLVVGTRVTLLATLQAVGTAIAVGVPAGLLAGYRGGVVDWLLGRLAEALMCVPALILAISMVGILGPGLTNAMFAVGIVFAPRFFRVARGAASSIRNEPYIEACRALGCSGPRILFRHVLPNSLSPLLIQTTYSLGLVVIAEASLSFLGLGIQAPGASWGGMTREAFQGVAINPFPMLPPLLMIFLTILGFSTLGDGVRDLLASGRRRQA